MVVYPGDPDVMLERVSSIADGDLANVSRLDFGVHTGTHVDAPVHFVDGAPGAESLPPAALVGEAVVHGTEAVRSMRRSSTRSRRARSACSSRRGTRSSGSTTRS